MKSHKENEIPLISWSRWGGFLVIALLSGFAVHWLITACVFWSASETAVSALPNFARNWSGIPPEDAASGSAKETPLPAADLMLRYLELPKDSMDPDLLKQLQAAYQPFRADASQAAGLSAATPERMPALVVAARLIGPNQSSECEETIIGSIAGALGRQLLGWPGNTEAELQRVALFRKARLGMSPPAPEGLGGSASPGSAASAAAIAQQIDQACDTYRAVSEPDIAFFGPAFWRTPPKSAGDLAELILGADACLPGGVASKELVECQLFEALLSATVNADEVRGARLSINFFWGWERAAVAILAILVLLAMGYLQQKRKPLERQEKWLQVWLAEADKRLSANKPPGAPVCDPEGEARQMHRQFHDHFGRKGARALNEWNGGLTVLRDLVDATQESLRTQHRAHLEKFVELHTQALARQRAFINAVITAFPAIGLVATLDGLIIALSRASGIVAGTEAERFASTELVTGVLSSSFATTMLALIAMAVCMLINVSEEHCEADLLENTHKRLIAVFWPGRPASATTVAPGREASTS